MIKIGMLLDERYEIVEKIGTGGMSDVYKAKDQKLNRLVAVKVLKQEFSENANFVSKFRTEAQAAAGLMHPNIVNVYDVGEENGIYFIVMELVDGITLKNYIVKKVRLTVKEAISIAIQVSMGIEAAHNNHIIHRDIKPQNIMISKDGKVKVTDFGIAKAASSNTITSNVMGSVHYTSPEQARGGFSDEKSDIYSLGITMFEMVTGRVPFNGDTTVAIAIKQIQEKMPSPREYAEDIPVSVEQIILKCCEKSADRRYQNMDQLIHDLKQSLITPDENFVKRIDADTEAATRMPTDTEMAVVRKDIKDTKDTPPVKEKKQSAMRLKKDEMEDEDLDDFDKNMLSPGMERMATILTIIAAIVVFAIVIVLAGKTFDLFGEKEADKTETGVQSTTVQMIDVIGKTYVEAQAALEEIGLDSIVEYEESDAYGENIVMRSGVEKGTWVQAGTVVTLTVSAGTSGVEVPDVTLGTLEQAYYILQEAGFVVEEKEGYSDEVEEGSVIRQIPKASSKAPEGSTIVLIVSQGPVEAEVRMPDLTGMTEEEAMVTLTEAGLALGNVTEVYNDDYNLLGKVCAQSVVKNTTVVEGTSVNISISKGPENATYSYSANIVAPTSEEDPDFVPGTTVDIQIIDGNGNSLLDSAVKDFPFSVNFKNLTTSHGTIIFNYTDQIDSVTTTDPSTGETTTSQNQTKAMTVRREVEFTINR
ncbi:MAG: Stk1 family PASTA domain-containing Ser/Thr kinase [Lachnospiraceae bacterium]|nr:Stk1 family PASTA domain-containing Ser/Thr kinase [Lachnospiraceae bacterium]